MSDDELVTIGHFARLSGLSVHALRHYDDVGLLAPAAVDPDTGYRRYRHDQTTARLGDVDRFLEEGITMPTVQTGARPVQLKVTVDDGAAAIAFYQQAFGFRYDVTRRTGDGDHSSFLFGTYGRDNFFLLHLLDDPDDTDRLGPATFGLLVDDLDATHARAVAAGGTEVVTPHSPEGMPRCSAVKDPSGNWIWLYQG